MSAPSSSALWSSGRAAFASLRARALPVLRRSGSTVRKSAAKWGGALGVLGAAYFLALEPAAREEWWARNVRAPWVQPLKEWRETQRQGARTRQLLAHFGLVPRGGDVLELFPGSGSASFPCLDALSAPDDLRVARVPLVWRGLDVDSAAWDAREVAHQAEQHAAVPATMLAFDSCRQHKRSFIELIRQVPDNSVGYVLALHGLSPLFSASPLTHAALSARPPPSDPSLPRPPTQDAELAVLLAEVLRVLKPGGSFVFVEEAQSRNRDDRIAHGLQRLGHALRAHLPGRSLAQAPTELAQHLPAAGFASLHIEQWPAWSDESNPRRGVRALRFTDSASSAASDEEDELYTRVEGLRGLHPLVAGVATKATLQRAAKPNIFTRPPPGQGQ